MQGIKPYRLDRLKSRSVISVVQGTPLTRTLSGSECSTMYADYIDPPQSKSIKGGKFALEPQRMRQIVGQAIRLSGSDKAGSTSFHR
jgi:hypothetical protein